MRKFLSLMAGAALLAGPALAMDEQTMDAPGIYSFANGCYALRDPETLLYVGKADGGWAADQSNRTSASAFFMKASGLGNYLLFDRDTEMMAVTDPAGDLVDELGNFIGRAGEVITVGGNIVDRTEEGRTPASETVRFAGRDTKATGYGLGNNRIAPALGVVAEPTDLAIWDLVAAGPGRFTLVHHITGLHLARNGSALGLVDAPQAQGVNQFEIVPSSDCAPFPEATTNATLLAPPKRLNEDGTVFGWVDAHQHIGGVEYLGGRVMYGRPVHRLGITRALEDCEPHHGPNGVASPLAAAIEGFPHETKGWPTFNHWPGAGKLLHHQTYYKWMERAFLAGQKLMINQFVENEGLCVLHGLVSRNDCDEYESIKRQRLLLLSVQDYVDAQEGGPGKGWFRIVYSPAQARQVIADGKMAVVMGAEVSKVLDCGETLDVPDCTLDDVRTRLDELYDLGLRTIFPIHRQDNAFGGTLPGGPEPINIVVASGTLTDSSHPYRLEECSAEGENQNDRPPPGILEEIANFASFLSRSGGGPDAPGSTSTDGEFCNARGLTPHGEYLVNELMRRGMMIEVDHSSSRVRDRILDLAMERNYPVITAHSWSRPRSFGRIWQTGGALNMYSQTGPGFVRNLQANYLSRAPEDAFLGVGIGTDANGMGPLPGRRGDADETPLSYPFTSYDGNVVFDRQQTGERVFDLNKEGVAHYGLFADMIGDMMENGGAGKDQAVEIFFNSAESWLRQWERAIGTRAPYIPTN